MLTNRPSSCLMECLSHCHLLESALCTALSFYNWPSRTRILVFLRPRPFKFASVFFPSWHASSVFLWLVSWLALWDPTWRRGNKRQFNWCLIKACNCSNRQSTSKFAPLIRSQMLYLHIPFITRRWCLSIHAEYAYMHGASLTSAYCFPPTSHIICISAVSAYHIIFIVQ